MKKKFSCHIHFNTNTDGVIERVHITGVSILSGLSLENREIKIHV